LADATTISGSAPTPLTTRPAFCSRTVTSPWLSVDPLMALTEYNTISAPLFTKALDRLQRGVDRAVAVRFAAHLLAVGREHHFGMRPLAGLAVLPQRHQPVGFLLVGDGFVADQRQDVLVEDLALAVGQFLELGEGGIDASASLSSCTPSSCRRCLKALRPDSLPSTILLAAQPTSSARMIS
jgi:hypothetical protein